MKRRTNSVYLALIVLLALAVIGARLPGARAQSPNRAGLVVRFGDGSVATRCVEFSEPQVSGYDVLMRSGLGVVAAYYSGEGTAICKIEHEGCSVEDCLTCAYPNYWSYWHLVDGAWVYSQASVSGYTVRNGEIEGWSWGSGEPPPVVPFDQICAPPPTDTPPPTNTLLPPTDTPPPTNTLLPPTATLPPPIDTPLPAPTAALPPPTPVVWFRLDDNPIPVGACTMVRWDTADALEVYLDGERVDLNGGCEVCPATSQEYHLRVVSAVGEQTDTLVLGVTGALPSPTFTPQPTLISSPPPSPTPQPAPATSPPPSPTSQSVADTSPSPSPTFPSAAPVSPSPSPTSERVALAPPSPSPTRAAQPTPTPPSSSSTLQPATDNQQPASSDEHPTSTLQLSYTAFGLIVVGLLVWLIFGMRRRK